uniref:Uncharacterized protein n=1 Tax=Romanomermis culicivorax TaxID=13658 RepID=A0A915K0C1_ROMCU
MEMCGWPEDQMTDRLAEILDDVWTLSSHQMNKDAKELALAPVVQTNRISEVINSVMKIEEDPSAIAPNPSDDSTSRVAASPSVPCSQLTLTVAPLMKCLTGLLPGLQSLEDEPFSPYYLPQAITLQHFVIEKSYCESSVYANLTK